ncbi:MAG: discoidin domain-containing protein [Melioribacteraceae bacterium]|nr:discoidin domain-containing protein [Melioribacteraceae bacterium]
MINNYYIAILLIFFSTHISAQDSTVVKVFEDNIIVFGHVVQEGIKVSDNGQTIGKDVYLGDFDNSSYIYAQLEIEKNGDLGDPWDRAGTILLSNGIDPDVEILKFMTAYAVPTIHRIDVSNLSSLLRGNVKITAHVSTYPDEDKIAGFKIKFKLVYFPQTDIRDNVWAKGIFYNSSLEKKHIDNNLTKINVVVPAGLKKIELNYFTSGHCTDGRGADEFEPKFNVIYIDGQEVYRFKPWRDDCANFPSNGNYWLSRSGWCPGDMVKPLVLDMTKYLSAGEHEIEFIVEDIRGIDVDGNYGYWRVSSYLTGFWEGEPPEVKKINFATSSPEIVSLSSEFVMTINFTDENNQLITGSNKNVKITSDKAGIYFSEDGINWEDSFYIFTYNESSMFFVKTENEGLFNIKASDEISGVEGNKEILVLNNFAAEAEIWGSDSTNSQESPRFACDGDLTTKWSDDSQIFPNTLKVTFDNPTELNYFVLYHAGSGGESSIYNTIDYEIEYYDLEKKTWQRVIEVEDNYETEEGNITTHYLDETIVTNSIQLKILYPEVNGEIARIYEFQMFNVSKDLYSDITSINEEINNIPGKIYLSQNYPNPFNGTTNIEFFINTNSSVKINIYNSIGQFVDKIFDGFTNPGVHSVKWESRNFKDTKIAGGIYYCVLEATNITGNKSLISRKMVYLP